jgi:hypothetical protein
LNIGIFDGGGLHCEQHIEPSISYLPSLNICFQKLRVWISISKRASRNLSHILLHKFLIFILHLRFRTNVIRLFFYYIKCYIVLLVLNLTGDLWITLTIQFIQ